MALCHAMSAFIPAGASRGSRMPSKPRTLAGILRLRRQADRAHNRVQRDPATVRAARSSVVRRRSEPRAASTPPDLHRAAVLCAHLCAVHLPRRCTSLHDRAGRRGRGPRCRVGAGIAQGRATARQEGQREWRERRDSNPRGPSVGPARSGTGSGPTGLASAVGARDLALRYRATRRSPKEGPCGPSFGACGRFTPGRLPPLPVAGSSPRSSRDRHRSRPMKGRGHR